MAAPTSAKRLLMVGAVVVVAAMLAAHQTEAQERSRFVFYAKDGCKGCNATLDACGCNTVPSNTRAGYNFVFKSLSAAAYNDPLCTGNVATGFSGRGTEQCTRVGWNSVFIQCEATRGAT